MAHFYEHCIEPTEEKAYFSKWMLLLIDGGTMVLRHIFDKANPPKDLGNILNHPPFRQKMRNLISNNTISEPQEQLLYPQDGSDPESSRFDISLLTCLLRYLPVGGSRKGAKYWSTAPSPSDVSVEADICRLRLLRNEYVHVYIASMSQATFHAKWTELEQVLLRLGAGIPGLKTKIDSLKEQSIDPVREEELKAKCSDWRICDAAIRRLNQRVRYMSREQLDQAKRMREMNSKLNVAQHIQRTTAKYVRGGFKRSFEAGVNTVRQEIKLAVTKKMMAPELEALVSKTAMYMEDCSLDDGYVQTSLHRLAMDTLRKQNVIILSGNPGEGKTTMALKLMQELTSSSKCLKLCEPSDWKLVDVGIDNFDVIFIDDIFGAGVMSEHLVKDWDKYLPDIQKACLSRSMKFIITSRQYILEDARGVLSTEQLFEDNNVISLSSDKLSKEEKSTILRNHMDKAKRVYQPDVIKECVSMASECCNADTGDGSRNIMFGFPQCVKMFVTNDTFFLRKGSFFARPRELFKKYIEELYKEEEKFLPLMLLWSRSNKQLKISELSLTSTSHEIKRIAKKFGFKLKPRLVKTIRKSLENHQAGFVAFNSREGLYSFSHQSIADMVGIVVSKAYPEVILELSSSEFLLNYVSVKSAKIDGYHFYIESYLYKLLSERLLHLFQDTSSSPHENAFKRFWRRGKCYNEITTENHLQSDLIFCDAFKKHSFIVEFVDVLEDKRNKDAAEKLLTTPLMKMSGHFLGRGIDLEKVAINLPEYMLLHGRRLLCEELLKRNTLQKLGHDKLSLIMPMLIGCHFSKTNFVSGLLEKGALISEESLYLAALNENTELLTLLLKKADARTKDSSRIFNGNNALTAASKKGLVSSVKCLVENGDDLTFRNSDGMCALDKAIIYRRVDVCKILIESGSPLNLRVGKHKRSPLHIACDTGLTMVVQMLLEHGASPYLKDAKGHYPIHCAAFQNRIGVVKVLLMHDINLAKQRIYSYRKASPVKGMTVFHIAIMNQFDDMLDALLELKADPNVPDSFGRTPFYCAVITHKNGFHGWSKLLKTADISIPEKQGFTPLHAALIRHDTIVYDFVIRERTYDVDFNAVDKQGRTPLHLAFSHGLMDLALTMILEYNADMNIVTKNGTSVYSILEKKSKYRKKFWISFNEDRVKQYFPQIKVEDGEIKYSEFVSLLELIESRNTRYQSYLCPEVTMRRPSSEFWIRDNAHRVRQISYGVGQTSYKASKYLIKLINSRNQRHQSYHCPDGTKRRTSVKPLLANITEADENVDD